MKQVIRSIKGFTLIELMITVTIVGILAAIAIPSYLNYTRRAHFSEVVMGTGPWKVGVTECYQTIGTITGCTNGANHVPADLTSTTGAIASITTSNGVITATPVAQNGILSSDTYILTPAVTNGTLIWTVSGGAVSDGLV